MRVLLVTMLVTLLAVGSALAIVGPLNPTATSRGALLDTCMKKKPYIERLKGPTPASVGRAAAKAAREKKVADEKEWAARREVKALAETAAAAAAEEAAAAADEVVAEPAEEASAAPAEDEEAAAE
jgi:hypothetical protein